MGRHVKPSLVGILIYIIVDNGSHVLLDAIGLDNWHAFLAMFLGMLAGGYLARTGFIPIALGINLFFSLLTYAVVAAMREQSLISLIAEQSLLVSVGSFVGAALGAWTGQMMARNSKAAGTPS